jgi:hypothetical protein
MGTVSPAEQGLARVWLIDPKPSRTVGNKINIDRDQSKEYKVLIYRSEFSAQRF